MIEHGAERFPEEKYIARNAQSDEILAALKELLDLPKEWTPLQNQCKSLFKESLVEESCSRVSQYFLENHKELLSD